MTWPTVATPHLRHRTTLVALDRLQVEKPKTELPGQADLFGEDVA